MVTSSMLTSSPINQHIYLNNARSTSQKLFVGGGKNQSVVQCDIDDVTKDQVITETNKTKHTLPSVVTVITLLISLRQMT